MKEGHLLSTAGVPRSEMRKTRDILKKLSAQNLRSLKTRVIPKPLSFCSFYHFFSRFGWGTCWCHKWRFLYFLQDLEGGSLSWHYQPKGKWIIGKIGVREKNMISWNLDSPFRWKSWVSSWREGNSRDNCWSHSKEKGQPGQLLEGQDQREVWPWPVQCWLLICFFCFIDMYNPSFHAWREVNELLTQYLYSFSPIDCWIWEVGKYCPIDRRWPIGQAVESNEYLIRH